MASLDQWRDDALERLRARRPHLLGRVRGGLLPARRDRTAIVTDSAAALPAQALAHPFASGIRQITVPVMVAEQIHTETSEDLQLELSLALASGQPVRTSRPSPGAFRAAYAELAAAGHARIVSVHMSGRLSGTVEAARLAAADAPVPVTVIDTRTAGFVLGQAVLDAAVEAGLGRPVEDVVARAEATAAAGHALFTVPHLEHLRRGGRIGAVSSLLGQLLQVRPVLTLDDDGAIALMDRPRSAAKALDRLVEITAQRMDGVPSRIVVHAFGDAAGAEELVRRVQPLSVTPVPVVELPGVLAAHLGLGALAVAMTPLEAPGV